ncbi:uncharacterized protein PWA37_001155 [Arxiozyma heterogenica]|uniref:uncharacterized protein n=1 Tax=Arxiozyma heterogenica TaxID=278026 RepID=UPI002F252BE7
MPFFYYYISPIITSISHSFPLFESSSPLFFSFICLLPISISHSFPLFESFLMPFFYYYISPIITSISHSFPLFEPSPMPFFYYCTSPFSNLHSSPVRTLSAAFSLLFLYHSSIPSTLPLFESQLLPFLFYFFITHQYLLLFHRSNPLSCLFSINMSLLSILSHAFSLLLFLFHCSNPLSCLFSITIFLPLSHYSSTSSTSFHYSLLLLSSIPLFYSLYPNIFFSLSLQN